MKKFQENLKELFVQFSCIINIITLETLSMRFQYLMKIFQLNIDAYIITYLFLFLDCFQQGASRFLAAFSA